MCEIEVGLCPLATVVTTGNSVVEGNTCAATDTDEAPSCSVASGGDFPVSFTALANATFVFDTINGGIDYDTALYARDSCGGSELACNDDSGLAVQSQIALDMLAGESVTVYVSGFASRCGNFSLDINPLVCGDSILAGDESCDDANLDDGDGCSAICEIEEGWDCADGSCLLICGDVVLNGLEACEDGNIDDGDRCSATCDIELGWNCEFGEELGLWICDEVCGDGVISDSETCDDGNIDEGDGCDSVCQVEEGWQCDTDEETGDVICLAICGDAIVLGDETCDDGNFDEGDGCDPVCQLEEGWQCDTDEETGDVICTAICGDGVILSDEECDDGNTDEDDGCASTCEIEDGWSCADEPSECIEDVVCGDGFLGGDEKCDDGNTDDGDGCDSTCVVEDGDEDGVADNEDNCPDVANPEQEAADEDGIGDACDEDVGEFEGGRVTGGGLICASTTGRDSGPLALLTLVGLLAVRRRR
ncbi:MAG: MYXO-CTERM domain-containing protein [Bradymonadia bacterium]